MRVLIIRPSALGDVCRTVPVLASVKAAWPGSTVDWVVRDTFVAAVAAHPALGQAIPFPRARFAAWWRKPAVAAEMLRWFSDLRHRRYELVLDCQGLGRSGLITAATGAARRVGYDRAREGGWLGYNVRHPVDPAVHAVDAMLSLVRGEGIDPVPDMRLYVTEADRRRWAARRRGGGVEPGRYTVLAPTARWASKRWPIDRWRALARVLLERGAERIVIVGAPGEAAQVRGIVPQDRGLAGRVVDFVGRVDVGQTMAAIAEADLLVGHDSAPLHMAVGLGRPCVGLFGPTDPARVGPYRRPQAVVQRHEIRDGAPINYRNRRLDDRLMRLITLEDVLERVEAVTAEARGGSPALEEAAR